MDARGAAFAAEMFAKLMTSPAARADAKEKFGVDFERFGQLRSKEEMVKKHEAEYRRAMTNYNMCGPVLLTTNNLGRKPVSGTQINLDAYTPVFISDLSVDTTHRGRLLRGTLIVEPTVMRGVHTILEDENGDAVYVSIYDALPEAVDGNLARQVRAAQVAFPKGKHIAIIEPYYKLRQDGTLGVRIDDPLEIVFLDHLGPSDAAGWQEAGKKHFKAQQYAEASRCYTKALTLLDQGCDSTGQTAGKATTNANSNVVSSILLNISLTHLKLKRAASALQYAATAVAITPGNGKAHYRLAQALDTLQLPQPARSCMLEAARLSNCSAPEREAWMKELKSVGRNVSSARKASPSEKSAGQLLMLKALTQHLQLPEAGVPASSAAGSSGLDVSLDAANTADKAAHEAACRERSQAAKERGNQHFRAGQHTQALEAYEEALLALSVLPTDVLLSNRSACRLRGDGGEDRLAGALLDASAALVLDATQLKAHYRRCEALLQLEWLNEADSACQLALSWHPHESALLQLQQRIRTATSGNPCSTSGKSTPLPPGSTSRTDTHRGSQSMAETHGGNEHMTETHNDQVANVDLSARGVGCSQESSRASQAEPSTSGSASGKAAEKRLEGNSTCGSSKKEGKKGKGKKGKTLPVECDFEREFESKGSSAGSSSSKATGRDREGFLGEREFNQMQNEGCLEVEQVATFNKMLELLPPAAKAKLRKEMGVEMDKRISPFHEEFSREGRWPAQVDVARCQRVLWNAYEAARGCSIHILEIKKTEAVRPMDVMKRLGTNDESALEWLLTAEIGDVRFGSQRHYHPGMCHSFSNVMTWLENLTLGTTHVAVGFVDLGALALSCSLWSERDCNGVSKGVRLLRWVGYELSEYSVAKTLVVAEMLRSGASVEAVLQVWYSAAWSLDTLSSFRSALTSLLSHPDTSHQPGPVLRLLRHWQVRDITLADARKGWLESLSMANTCISNFKRKQDRMALCAYLVTGQLMEAEVGSVTMFGLPKDVGEKAMDENFLQTLQTEELYNRCLKTRGTDIVQMGVTMLRERVSRLQQLMMDERVTVEVRWGAVTPSAHSTLSDIRALQPYTISWSNVCDYLHPRDFHAMARACSAPEDTVHYLHSMNWPIGVKGACHIDMLLSWQDSPIRDKAMMDLFQFSKDTISSLYKAHGYDALLLTPPVDSARNVVDFALFVSHSQAWADAFFKEAKLENPGRQAVLVAPPMYWPLQRTSSTMYLTYSFDNKMSFSVKGR